MVAALYLHIPFCKKICPFCSFAVRPDHPQKHASYFELIQKEFDLVCQTCTLDFSDLGSIYFGGGTPSRLLLTELEEWVVWLNRSVRTAQQAEWSIEINPEDMSPDYATGLVGLGFNRVSLGVQSFSEEGLNRIGRQHTPDKSRQAIYQLQEAGITNLNLDLIFGYPGQTLDHLEADLAELVQWDPPHISAYCLTIEKRTPIFRKPDWQKWQDDHEERIVSMYHLIVNFLSGRGYRQYEISNFAKKGYQSRQNLCNWNGKNYLGLGMGAHSLIFPFRWGNQRRWVDYKKALLADHLPREFDELLDRFQIRDELLMMSLRQKKGLNLVGFESNHAPDLMSVWGGKLEQLIAAGLADVSQGRLRLTTAGMLLADELTSDLAVLLDDTYPPSRKDVGRA